MHRSVITLSLFLMMSTLIMLVPFTSRTFPNVKAQEYGTFDDDYNDDMYSIYPTEINKYECRTGPFEGFFVSSVEFCIAHSFDDDKKKKDRPIKPPVPPTPPTGSLTVNKEIFGCNNIINNQMDCFQLPNNSPLWLPCTDPTISNTAFCQNLPPNLFDIEVLGQIQQFEGSTTGTTIQNPQPDSFIVNEIVHEDLSFNQLVEVDFVASTCEGLGFDGGGQLIRENPSMTYIICIEYEDEQGNDCNPITIATGEEKTCTRTTYYSGKLALVKEH